MPGLTASHAILKQPAISLEEMKNFFMQTPAIFVWFTNENLQTSFLNKTGLHYFNLDETTDLAKLSWKKFIHPDDLDRVLAIMNESSEKHESYTLKMRLKNGVTGEYRWFLDNGMPQYDEDGEFSGFIGTTLDIHEQEMSGVLELENRNKELNEAQRIARLGNWDWDVATNEVKWSDQMFNIYGYGLTHFPVNFDKALERMRPEDAENVKQRIKRFAIAAERAFKEKGETEFINPPFEYSIFLPDGSKKILRGEGKIILNTSGKVSKIVGTVQDITESTKQIEELKKLYESDKLKSDFIKMASHELKTPVTSIKGYVQLLLEALKKEEEKEISPLLLRSSLISIDKQVSRLTRLLSELLDLSKIESGKLELNKELFNLNELVIDTVQDILYTNSKFTIHISHDFGCTVLGDKDRIGQVLINLLTNAIKYSPAAKRIDISIKRSGTKHVSISIKDQGIGIDKKYHEKIFERFYRAEEKEEQTYPGFGIGLFIAKEIIQQHEGSIQLVSEKGKGSIFTFTIPLGH